MLGINTCFAVKRWPRVVDWAPVVRERLGLGMVQLSLDLIDLRAGSAALERIAAEHRAVAADHGIDIISVFTGLAAYSGSMLLHPDPAERDAAEDWYRSAIDLAAMVGAASVGGHLGAFSVQDFRDPKRRAALWSELQDRLARLAEHCHGRGVGTLLVENLAARREPSTMADIESLITDGDGTRAAIRLCLDLGHMCAPDTSGPDRDPYAWLERLGPHAAMIQLQQSDEQGDHHWPFTRASASRGRIIPERVLATLTDGHAVPLVLEVIPPFEQHDDEVLADLIESADTWRAALRGTFS